MLRVTNQSQQWFAYFFVYESFSVWLAFFHTHKHTLECKSKHSRSFRGCSLFLLAVILFWFYNKIHINLKLIICGIINLFSVRNFAPWCVRARASLKFRCPSLSRSASSSFHFISFENALCLFSWSYDRRVNFVQIYRFVRISFIFLSLCDLVFAQNRIWINR